MTKKIIIVDYGVGNLWSLKRAFEECGSVPPISSDAETLTHADALVLPGVGSFGAAMRGLKERRLVATIQRHAAAGKPLLGICLGAQILLSKGYEFGEWDGLNIISGKAVRFPETVKEKVPHIGWNTVKEGKREFDAYFVHSYILVPDNPKDCLGVTEYGGLRFCSAVKRGAVYGTQFHPEKSGEAGLALIKKFVSLSV